MAFRMPEVTNDHIAEAVELLPRITKLKGKPTVKLAGLLAAALYITEQRDALLEAAKQVANDVQWGGSVRPDDPYAEIEWSSYDALAAAIAKAEGR